ncbi:MAG: COX15/CtaA family protein [Burkholderiaceae bacterium]
MYKRLIGLVLVMTLGLIMLGAYVRLSDAGLGCPDWPGCYGRLSPSHAQDEIAQAVERQGGEHGPVSLPKAWKEMLHRYVASGLGLLLIMIAALAWRPERRAQQSPWLATALVAVVCLQGAFGAWTVTMLLKPAIVTGHLIGGMTLLALLACLYLRQSPLLPFANGVGVNTAEERQRMARAQIWARWAVVAVALQIVLGGWVSTNYAALACIDLPTCQDSWWPAMNFTDAFHVFRELGKAANGEMLPLPALTAIHWSHRLGALLVTFMVTIAGICSWQAGERRPAVMLWVILALQLTLGVGNVVFQLPLWLAVLHNGGAALLLLTMIFLNDRLHRKPVKGRP